MKKIVYVLISLFVFLPLMVFADMSGPLVREYEFQVTNPNGAQVYDYDIDNYSGYYKLDKKVPYNYKFTVYEEDGGDDYIYVDEYDGYINKKDGRSIVEKFELSEKNLSKKYDAIVIKDVEVRKGPSDGYDVIGTIKEGTKIYVRDILIYDEDSNEYHQEEFDPWVYVEYNNMKGYINSYNGYLGFNETQMAAVTAIDVKLIDPKTDKVIDVIPANKKLTVTGYYMDVWSSGYYIKYNDKFGIVPDNYFVIKYKNVEFKALEKLNIYENCASLEGGSYDDSVYTSKVLGTISKGTKFNSEYYETENGYAFIRYEKGNSKGWICVNVDLSDEPQSEYKGIDFKYPTYDEEDTQSDITEPNDDNGEIKDENSKLIIPSKNKVKKMEMIYLCIGAALLMTLTAIITILLINKKKSMEEKNQI